jgi:RHS repeat-associated protein
VTIWDEWDLIEERDSTGALLQKYIHGATIDELLAKVDGSGAVYYHQDGLASTVALTDAAGMLQEEYQYDAFGMVSMFDGAGSSIPRTARGNRFLYTGRELLDAVLLYDYRNRFYSPDWGRFLQIDSIRFDSGVTNLYAYVANTPTSYIDPLGLAAIPCPGWAYTKCDQICKNKGEVRKSLTCDRTTITKWTFGWRRVMHYIDTAGCQCCTFSEAVSRRVRDAWDKQRKGEKVPDNIPREEWERASRGYEGAAEAFKHRPGGGAANRERAQWAREQAQKATH